MRLRIVCLAAVPMLTLSACQTGGATPQTAATQSDRLLRLASNIEAQGESGTAIALYEKAAALPDAKPSAFVKTGDAYMRAGYPAEASKAYSAALAKAPNDGPALLGLGSAMIVSGDAEAGLRVLEQAAPIVNSSRAYNRLGVAQTFAGQLGLARETFERALRLSPADLDIQTNMALAAALEDKADFALPLIQRVAADPAVQMHHERNVVVVYGLLGRADVVKQAPPTGLTSKQIATLLARAKSIRAKRTAQARARALGSMSV